MRALGDANPECGFAAQRMDERFDTDVRASVLDSVGAESARRDSIISSVARSPVNSAFRWGFRSNPIRSHDKKRGRTGPFRAISAMGLELDPAGDLPARSDQLVEQADCWNRIRTQTGDSIQIAKWTADKFGLHGAANNRNHSPHYDLTQNLAGMVVSKTRYRSGARE